MSDEYFCSYILYVNGKQTSCGSLSIEIGVDIKDKLNAAKEAVAEQYGWNVKCLVFVAFNKI